MDLGQRVEADFGVTRIERLEDLGEILQHLDIEDELLQRGGEPALEPAGGMEHHVDAAQDRSPGREQKLVD